MAVAEPSEESRTSESGWSSGGDSSVLTIGLDGEWRADEFAALITALRQIHDVLLALHVDAQAEARDLTFVASHLRTLAPENQLEIASVQYASPGEISLRGSGEIIAEMRQLVADLETIGQRRQQNKLELESKKQELAHQAATLRRQQQLDEIEISRLKRQNELELDQLRQQVLRTDMDLASQFLALLGQMFEMRYGPEWRMVNGAQDEFAALAAGGNEVLRQLTAQRVLPPGEAA